MSSALPAAASVAGVLLAVEVHHPGIDSLRLTPQVARAWTERLAHIRDTDGQPLRSSSPAHAFAALAGHGWEYRRTIAAQGGRTGPSPSCRPPAPARGRSAPGGHRGPSHSAAPGPAYRAPPSTGRAAIAGACSRRIVSQTARRVTSFTLARPGRVAGHRKAPR